MVVVNTVLCYRATCDTAFTDGVCVSLVTQASAMLVKQTFLSVTSVRLSAQKLLAADQKFM